MVEYDFTMTLKDGCLLDELSSPSTIDGLSYYIAASGLQQIPTPTFTRRVENCAIGWSLVAVDPDSGDEIELSDTQKQFITLQTDGQVDIDVGDDYSVLDEAWNLKLKATSTSSTVSSENVVEYGFSIDLVDGCQLDELSDPSTIGDVDYYIAASG